MTHGPWGFTNFLPILYYGRDFRAGLGPLPAGRQVTEASERNGHPCPKPIAAWTWLIHKVSQHAETILDPFMGSGTTGVVANMLNRRFILVDQNPEALDVIKQRLEGVDYELVETGK
jgi:DNA modification methylase